MKNQMVKRVLAGVAVLTLAVVGVSYMPENVQAANVVEYEEASGIVYQGVENTTFKEHINAHKAPVYTSTDATDNTGYLFAGWYTMVEQGENYTPGTVIEAAGSITESVFAKFVPSYLAGIACQVDVNNGDTAKRNLRVVSLVDSTNYKAVGFNVYGRYDKDGNGTNEWEWLMYQYSSETTNKAESTKVYNGLYEYSTDETEPTLKYPKDLFGTKAEGFYFTTVSIGGITQKFFDATMAVKPYWITLDGTYVEGMGEFNRINDSKVMNNDTDIVNVSVNIKDAAAVAAGMLDITYPDGFTFVEAEGGRVFEEMEFAKNEHTIRCIGNVLSLANNEKPNEVYVNLRFKKEAENNLEAGAAEFTVNVSEESFCNVSEDFVAVSAWNVKY